MGQQWVGGRATLSQEYPHPAPGALCPLIPHPLLFYFPRCLITNVPPAKWSRCLGPFPYCPVPTVLLSRFWMPSLPAS